MPYPIGDAVSGSLTGTGRGSPFRPGPGWGQGRYNLNVSGTFTATWRVVRSFDGGDTWQPATIAGAAQSFTTPASEVLMESGSSVLVAVEVTSYTSGTLRYTFQQ